jgi:uncharacterized Zn-binding protein involved in type VI secretion
VGAISGAILGAVIVVAEAIVGAVTAEIGIGVGLIAHALLGGASTILAISSAGAAIGKWIGGGSTSIQGYISTGAARTFVGLGLRKAARVGDKVDCDGSNIDQGSKTVFVENQEFARRLDITMCAGKIAAGCETVFVGGGTMDLVAPDQLSEDDPVQAWTMLFVDWGGAVVSLLKTGLQTGWKLWSAFGPELLGFVLRGASTVSDVVLGKDAELSKWLNRAKAPVALGKAKPDVKNVPENVGEGAQQLIKEGEYDQVKRTIDESPAAQARREGLQRRLRIKPKTIWNTRAYQEELP